MEIRPLMTPITSESEWLGQAPSNHGLDIQRNDFTAKPGHEAVDAGDHLLHHFPAKNAAAVFQRPYQMALGMILNMC